MFSYYLKLALRSIRRNPVLSTLMVLALGLGIGAFMTTYTVYYLMSGDPIPHKSDVLYAVQLDNWDPNDPPTESQRDVQPQLTWRDAEYLMHNPTPASDQAAMYRTGAIVETGSEGQTPFEGNIRATYPSFFPMFDVPFRYGRPWDLAAESGHERVVVLSRKMNDELFEGENSLGRTVKFNDTPFQVVGVLDDWRPTPRFYQVDSGGTFGDAEDFYVPLNTAVDRVFLPHGNVNCWLEPDGGGIEAFLRSECVWLQFWAELATPDEAASYKDFLDNYVRSQKETGRFPRPLNTFITPVMEWMDVMEVVSTDNRVLVRVAFLFLLVCVLNTVGLLLAKFLGKCPEVALRRAMGASRRAIFSQNLVEIGLIGVLGGAVGLAFAWLGLQLIDKLYRGYQHLVHLDAVMLVTALVIAVAASIAAGLYPVWRVTRLAPAGFLKTQ
ncbi:ABC transporter permease [Elongatibacter sediminis]|uniref:ABC transporter permease n=1 Tax=Elongatibacter sediminis TaxID=3119006 RepID=A0AAW9RFG1_9GAMM